MRRCRDFLDEDAELNFQAEVSKFSNFLPELELNLGDGEAKVVKHIFRLRTQFSAANRVTFAFGHVPGGVLGSGGCGGSTNFRLASCTVTP